MRKAKQIRKRKDRIRSHLTNLKGAINKKPYFKLVSAKGSERQNVNAIKEAFANILKKNNDFIDNNAWDPSSVKLEDKKKKLHAQKFVRPT